MDWTTIENALAAWVRTSTGAPVVWSAQNGPRPATPYVSLQIINTSQGGHDWLDVIDVVDPEPGEEIEHRATGYRTATLSVQCFGDAATSSNLLEQMIGARLLPTRAAALNAAGVGIGTIGPVQRIDALMQSTYFEPRTVCDVSLHLVSTQSELGTYIETADVTGDVT